MTKKSINSLKGISVFIRPTFDSKLGYFTETYKKSWLSNEFLQDSISLSKERGTVRGMHLQKGRHSQAKLVTVLQGSILDIFVDLRKESNTFCDYGSLKLSKQNNKSLFIPRGFAHGFITLEPNTLVSYKMDNHYSPKHEVTLKWDDPDLKINWPKKDNIVLSPKDLLGISLKHYLKGL